MSLLVGFGAKKRIINEASIREVIKDMEDDHTKKEIGSIRLR